MLSGRENAYAADYAAGRILKEIADQYDVTILIIHHTRKLDANDPVALVSGTNGLAGAVDSILQREPNGGDATLYLRGRDVEEQQFTLAYDRERRAWNVSGEARAVPLTATRERIVAALEAAAPETLSSKEVAARTGLSDGVVRQRLMNLEQAGLIRRAERGRYTVVTASADTTQISRNNRNNAENPHNDADSESVSYYDTHQYRNNDESADCYERHAERNKRDDQNRRSDADCDSIVTVVTASTPSDSGNVIDLPATPHEHVKGFLLGLLKGGSQETWRIESRAREEHLPWTAVQAAADQLDVVRWTWRQKRGSTVAMWRLPDGAPRVVASGGSGTVINLPAEWRPTPWEAFDPRPDDIEGWAARVLEQTPVDFAAWAARSASSPVEDPDVAVDRRVLALITDRYGRELAS